MSRVVAVDIGGTFTDLAAFDPATGAVTLSKSLTTYNNYFDGIEGCFKAANLDFADIAQIKHGTTLVINTLIERKGSRTALLTTKGFRDVLEIGRGNRPEPFNLTYRRDAQLVERRMRFELTERKDFSGATLIEPDMAELEVLAHRLQELGAEAVAISFVNAYADPAHERAVADALNTLLPDVYVTIGTDLSREWYEFERTSTAVSNAYVGPTVSGYLRNLDHSFSDRGFTGRIALMGSGGGVMSTGMASDQPVQLVESGPIGGLVGTRAYAEAMGYEKVIAFDMGGTTAKCSVLENGSFEVAPVYFIGGYDRGFPIRASIIDIVEVGAGGGSIAQVDAQGRLQVGPESAGSTPGPVAYARGGERPTVTDANFVLGRLNPGGLVGGGLNVDVAAARSAISERVSKPLGFGEGAVERSAVGILQLANVIMSDAIKRVTLERGADPRAFVMFAYGGGGPLHAAQLARELAIPTVVIPPHAGNFSAVGMLMADIQTDASETLLGILSDEMVRHVEARFEAIDAELLQRLQSEFGAPTALFEHQVELRYPRQMHSLRIPVASTIDLQTVREDFLKSYRTRFGHADAKSPLELVGLRSVAYAATARPGPADLAGELGAEATPEFRNVVYDDAERPLRTPIYSRSALRSGFSIHGPAVVEDYGTTCLIGPADRLEIGQFNEIIIHIGR